MRVLYLYCHPLSVSFHAALKERALEGLGSAGHDVDLLDLYAEDFDPVLSEQARRDYHDTGRNQAGLEGYVDRLRRAEGLVVQFPVWTFGPPAMLKGYFDRLMIPGVGFDLTDPANVRSMLGYTRLAGITTYGRPWTRALAMGDPPRKMVTRYLRWMSANPVRVNYHALYHINVATADRRQAFVDKVGRAMARF